MKFVSVLVVGLGVTGVIAANDGIALTPPMGWRDWNQFQCKIDQAIMESAIVAMADTSRGGVSLQSLGFGDVGLDDCWQQCGSYGPNNYTFHDATGAPVVNTTAFPDMKGMVDFAHSKNFTIGFYSNNCKCRDSCSDVSCFAGDVKYTLAAGFDSIKLDGCSAELNVQLWYDMFSWETAKQGRKGVMIENCHNGPSNPTPDWCPFHMYRSSTDIRPIYGSILTNLETIPPINAQNLSTPGCWAYPDMLEVGVMNTQSDFPPLSFIEARTHFGAWCIVSAPLVLGLDVTNSTTVDAFWPILSNTDAIGVNQAYAGDSGTKFWESDELTFFEPCGWWLANCTYASQMYWKKALPEGKVAVLLMNNADTASTLSLAWDDVPGLLPVQGTLVQVYDLWNHQDLGIMAGGFAPTGPTASRDSIFLILTPKSARTSPKDDE